MATLATLRKEAKAAGISASVIRSATSADELQSIIADHSDEAPKPVKKSAVKKKSGSSKKVAARKSTAVKSKPAVKSTSGKAKRKTTGTDGPVKSAYVPKGGRNVLDGVDFTFDDGWTPRDGSAPDRIIKALRKARGNREKAFDALAPDVWDFVGKKFRNGEKRTKQDALNMLAYRIARTAWDFALRTGQHEKAKNRVEYGTGGTGNGTWKPVKKKSGGNSKRIAPTRTTGRKSGTSKKSTAARKAGTKKNTARRHGRQSTKR